MSEAPIYIHHTNIKVRINQLINAQQYLYFYVVFLGAISRSSFP